MEADVLSHIPRASNILIDAPAVKANISAIPYTDHTDYNYNPSNIVCKSTQGVVHKKSRDDWRVEQENDPIIGPAIEAISPRSIVKMHLVMKVDGYYIIEVDYCSGAVYYTGKCLMGNYRRINSSLYYLNPIGNKP